MSDYVDLFLAFMLGFWLRPIASRLFAKLNQKLDEWAE